MPFKVISVNVNGIRAAAKKGFFDWLRAEDADVLCLQEVRADPSQIDDALYYPEGYECFYRAATKKGYSGVAIYTKHKPNKVVDALGYPLADDEGRYIHIELNDLVIASLYLPSGTSGEGRQDEKYAFMDWYLPFLKKQKKLGKKLIICGDWNIAHKELDLKNWKTNQKNSGFLPEERAWLDKVFAPNILVDAFRCLYPNEESYTWWSNRARAWEKNVGWRIDYQVISPELQSTLLNASVYKDERFSDHAPLIVEYDVKLKK